MKRCGGLFEKIASLDNLLLAYCKARRGKQLAPEVMEFGRHLDTNLASLRRGLLDGSLTIGNYHCFTVYDPKERVICAAPFHERVLHHAIMNLCESRFERFQIFDSYACRKGKGVYAALERALRFARASDWFLKLDVRKYFDSVDQTVLRGQLRGLFREKPLLGLLDRILSSYQTASGKGLPIGNLTSQFFANHYLATMDHFIKETLRVRRYVRYMDDFVLWDSNKETLRERAKQIADSLAATPRLDLKKPCMNRCAQGMSFLGYRVFPHGLTLTRRSRDRFRRKMQWIENKLRTGEWNERQAADHALPLLAFVRHAQTLNFRRGVLA